MIRLDALAAPIFVVLWSTGFIGAKYGLPYVEPFTFLGIRFTLVAVLFALWVWLTGAPLPTRAQARDAAIIGVLLHGVYLGAVFWAISLGVEAGVSALIVGLQPVLTALIAARVLGERLCRVQWVGMALGFAGVGLVVAHKLGDGFGNWHGVGLCVIGLIGISVGSILQKTRGADHPRRSATGVQFAAALVLIWPMSFLIETQVVVWSFELIFAMVWLIFVLSFGAVLLLTLLIRRGAATNVASLFFLVPPTTALMAWAVFGESLGPVELIGVAATAVGVLLVNQPQILRWRRA